MNTWPDPTRPGVPLNPERDGWHWISSAPHTTCIKWIIHNGGMWHLGTVVFPADTFALTGYAGPCPTPTELAAMLREERARGMEDAAGIAERVMDDSFSEFSPNTAGEAEDAIRAAAAKMREAGE